MPIALFRVDERLIHGQVTVGWGSALDVGHYAVVDDELADSEWEAELYRLGVPEGARASFLTVTEARIQLDNLRDSAEVTVVMTRSIPVMGELARDQVMAGESVNLGGLHDAPDRRRVLDYLHLDDRDRDAIRRLLREGVSVSARDLPGAPVVRSERLLDEGA